MRKIGRTCSLTARELYNESWEQTATDMIGRLN